MYPDSIRNLIESFKFFPGIGEKTAERLSFSFLNLEEEQVDFFLKSLSDVNANIHPCPICNTITDKDVCNVCADNIRNSNILCVVEDSKSVFLFEKLGMFSGRYHVLDEDVFRPGYYWDLMSFDDNDIRTFSFIPGLSDFYFNDMRIDTMSIFRFGVFRKPTLLSLQ